MNVNTQQQQQQQTKERRPYRLWTNDLVILEARKYKTQKDFIYNAYGAYQYAYKNGILKQCQEHFTKLRLEKQTLIFKETKDYILSKYKTSSDLKKYELNLFYRINYRGWIRKIFPKKTFSLNECKKVGKKYVVRDTWRKNKDDKELYYFAYRNGWLKKCCPNAKYKNSKKRNYETCFSDAKKYKSINEWQENDFASYLYTWRKGWVHKIWEQIKKDRK